MIKGMVLLALIVLIILVGFMWLGFASLEKQNDEIRREIQELKKMVGDDK